MPFGLCNAPGTFQRLMERVLAGLHWTSCLVYIDDIIIFSQTMQEHLHHLRDVFTRLRDANLKIKPAKCHLLQKSVDYLGHTISCEGVRANLAKIQGISAWKTPTDSKELKRFLGLASYYRRFVKNFAQIASPLHRLTQAGRKWSWTPECESAFTQLKQQLTTTPMLAFPDFSRAFILDVDASGEGLGAILSQNIDGREYVIAYASRTLSKAERQYCATSRELLALIWGAQHFRPYLYGQCMLCGPHGSQCMLSSGYETSSNQRARSLEILSEYNMEIEHRPGRQHTNVDALSRSPCSQCGKDAEDRSPIEEPDLIALAQCSDTWLLKWSPTDLRKHQYSDEDLKVVIQWLEKRSVPSRFPKDGSHYLKALWNQRSQLILQEGVLYRHWKDIPDNGANPRLQLVLPTCLVPDILTELHNSPTGGHLGANKTYEKMRSRIYYVNLQKTVEDWCRQCELCSSRKAPTEKSQAPMQLSVTSKPMERIAMDILGPLPTTARNNEYILVVGDYFSKCKEFWHVKAWGARVQ